MRVVLVGVDLMGRGRLDPVLDRARADVVTAAPGGIAGEADLVIADLDAVGSDRMGSFAAQARSSGARVVGFMSHVDGGLARAAADAGVEPYPRGRFWRELDAILGLQAG